MNKKDLFLVGVVAVLVGVYAVYFTDWFRPKVMRIEHSARSLREAWTGGGQRVDMTSKLSLGDVSFSLNHAYRLTSVKVVPLADYQTNKYAHPLWELVAQSGSQPLAGFAYGMALPGMTPARSYLEPEPLEAGVEYRLLVEAGAVKGEHDFKISRVARAGR